MTEVALAVLAFVAVAMSLAIAGGIDARLMQRHPAESERLGPMQNSLPLGSGLLRHLGRWLRFLFLGNFSRRDPVLTLLCLAYVGNLAALVALGVWLIRNDGAAV